MALRPTVGDEVTVIPWEMWSQKFEARVHDNPPMVVGDVAPEVRGTIVTDDKSFMPYQINVEGTLAVDSDKVPWWFHEDQVQLTAEAKKLKLAMLALVGVVPFAEDVFPAGASWVATLKKARENERAAAELMP